MKKINTSNITATVQAPYLKATFDHYNQSIAECSDSIVKGLINSYTTNDLIVLYGCYITFPGALPGNATVSAGAIYYNGEIYLVDLNNTIAVGVGQTLCWEIVTTYAAGDPVFYSDNNTYNQHQINKMAPVAATSGSGIADYTASTVKNLYTVLNGTKTAFTLNSGYTSGGPVPSYRKDFLGNVKLSGLLVIGSPGASTMATLPVGYRPVNAKSFIINVYFGTTITPLFCTITTTGDVQITTSAGATVSSEDIYLDIVSFNIND